MTTTTCFEIDASIIPTKANLINSLNKISNEISRLTLEGEPELAQKIDSELEQIKSTLLQYFPLSIGYPVFGDLRNPELEWEKIITALQQEYHLYVQTMMLDVINSLIPINFEVSIFGLNVDLFALISDKDYNTQLKLQVVEKVDAFYEMLPDSYKAFGGEYGIDYPTLKADAVWSYIKAQFNNFALNFLHDAFGALIDEFKTIWDALGLPSLPDLTDLGVEELVLARINSWETKLENLDETLINKRNELYNDLLEELNSISLVGLSAVSIIGDEIETSVIMIEQEIDRIIEALRDFGEAYPKKLILEWVDTIMEFLDAIGIGSLISDLLALDFSKFLTTIVGFPTCITVTDKSDNGN
jgi:hypothetical protein